MFLNSDPTTHNIHPLPNNNREWNVSQPPGADKIVQSFPREELLIPVKCNVHPWMRSYIAVLKHPFYAVTGEEGTFELKGLPPGEYVVAAWHEKYGTQRTESQRWGPRKTRAVGLHFLGSGHTSGRLVDCTAGGWLVNCTECVTARRISGCTATPSWWRAPPSC